VRRRLRGEKVDRPPNFDIYMQRAAHHVGRPLSRYYLDHRVLVEANLAVLEAFDLDIVQAISDPYREASDLGLEIEWPEDGLPVRRTIRLREPEDAARLDLVAPEDGPRMSDRIAAVRLLRKSVGDDVPVMGWVEGAFALASVLRGDTNVLLDIHDRPEWLEDLLDRLVEVGVAFARAQVAAGAHVIGLFHLRWQGQKLLFRSPRQNSLRSPLDDHRSDCLGQDFCCFLDALDPCEFAGLPFVGQIYVDMWQQLLNPGTPAIFRIIVGIQRSG